MFSDLSPFFVTGWRGKSEKNQKRQSKLGRKMPYRRKYLLLFLCCFDHQRSCLRSLFSRGDALEKLFIERVPINQLSQSGGVAQSLPTSCRCQEWYQNIFADEDEWFLWRRVMRLRCFLLCPILLLACSSQWLNVKRSLPKMLDNSEENQLLSFEVFFHNPLHTIQRDTVVKGPLRIPGREGSLGSLTSLVCTI